MKEVELAEKLFATCPVCTCKLCRGDKGSSVDIICPRCKNLIAIRIEKDIVKTTHLNEKFKSMPWGAIWEEYLSRQGLDENWLEEIQKYEREVLLKRN